MVADILSLHFQNETYVSAAENRGYAEYRCTLTAGDPCCRRPPRAPAHCSDHNTPSQSCLTSRFPVSTMEAPHHDNAPAPRLVPAALTKCYDCSNLCANGRKRCQDCLARNAASAAKSKGADPAVLEERRNADAQLDALLAASGFATGRPQLPDGFLPCSSGHSAHHSEFDVGKRTCRKHLSKKADARREPTEQQNISHDASTSNPAATAKLSRFSQVRSSASDHGSALACDEADEDSTALTANDWIKETRTFDDFKSAEKFVEARGHEEGSMFLERNTSAQRAQGKLYLRCHCYQSPRADKGTLLTVPTVHALAVNHSGMLPCSYWFSNCRAIF